jgi:cell division transport system ATP-binding protein
MLLSFEHVHLSYEHGRSVLEDVNLNLARGSFHFLTGLSGAGKSSLLRLIYAAERPTSGRITVLGQNLSKLKPDEIPAFRQRLGIVFQDFRLLPHLTALENVALPLRLAGASETEARAHVTELLNWVGLGDRLDAHPAALSGGEQQRVAIARAIVNKPKLLIADEPTGNVDDASARKILRLFIELNKMGTSVLLATHRQASAERLGFPVLKLHRGHVVSSMPEAA